MQYKYMQVQTVHKFYSGAMMIVQYTLIVWEHDMGLIGKKKKFLQSCIQASAFYCWWATV